MSGPSSSFELNLGNIVSRLKGPQPIAERDGAGLPYTDPNVVAALRTEYEEAAQLGGQEALEKCFNLSWALVHARSTLDVRRGLDLVEAMLHSEGTDKRELRYLQAVGLYRQRYSLEARRALKELLEDFPEFRQAESLLDACETEIVKDGLIGVGAGAAALGIVTAIAVAALKRR